MAVGEARQAAAGIHAEAQLGGKPCAPVNRLLHACIELLAMAAGKDGQLPQQPEGQAGLQLQAIEAGQIGAEAHGAVQGFHACGPELAQFLRTAGFKQ